MHADLLQWVRDDTQLKSLLAPVPGEDWPLIYWNAFPASAQNVFPALKMRSLTPLNQRSQKSEGHAGLKAHRVQFDVYADDPLDVRQVMDRLLIKFDFQKDKISGDPRVKYGDTIFCKITNDSDRDMPVTDGAGDGVDIFHISGDFIIWHRPVGG